MVTDMKIKIFKDNSLKEWQAGSEVSLGLKRHLTGQDLYILMLLYLGMSNSVI